MGARGLSFCTPESPTLLFTCPSLHKTHMRTFSPLIFLYLSAEWTQAKALPKQRGRAGAATYVLYVRLPFCTSTLPPGSCPLLSDLPVSLSR